MADLFKLQDQVVARLAQCLGFRTRQGGSGKERPFQEPGRDRSHHARLGLDVAASDSPWTRTGKHTDAARALFDQALQIDPNDADALAGDAFTYHGLHVLRMDNHRDDYERKVLGHADRAIALAPDNMRAYWAKSDYLS